MHLEPYSLNPIRSITDSLIRNLSPYHQPLHNSIEEDISELPKSALALLYRSGYCSEQFRDALETLFASKISHPRDAFEGFEAFDPLGQMTSHETEEIDDDVLKGHLLFALAQIADSVNAEALAAFLTECAGPPLVFPVIDLLSLKDKQEKLPELVELGRLNLFVHTPPERKQVDCLEILSFGVSLSVIRSFMEYRINDAPVFTTASHLCRFLSNGGTAEIFTELSRRNEFGEQLFETTEELLRATYYLSSQHARFLECKALKDQWGGYVFRYGEELLDYFVACGDPSLAKDLANITTQNGSKAFTGYQIAMLAENNFSYQECLGIALRSEEPLQEIYKRIIGVQSADFSNDGRPKALLLLPSKDPKAFFTRAFQNESSWLLKSLAVGYDICIRPVNSVQQTADLIKLYGPDCALVQVSGHGTKDSIELGRDTSRYNPGALGKNLDLRSNDPDFILSLDNLRPETVLFLDSCSTAEDDNISESLAENLARSAPHVALVAASAPFKASDIIIEQLVPIRLRILANYKDRTFTSWDGTTIRGSKHLMELIADAERSHTFSIQLPPSFLTSIPKDTADRNAFVELEKRFGFFLYPYAVISELTECSSKVSSLPRVSVIEPRDPVESLKQRSWQWLFGEHLRCTWCAPFGDVYGADISRIEAFPIEFLFEKGFVPVVNPQDGDIVLYFFQEPLDSKEVRVQGEDDKLPRRKVFHFGVSHGQELLSKPSGFPVIRHPLEIFPSPNTPLDFEVTVLYLRRVTQSNLQKD